jgi:hypothetical protein
MTLTEWIKTETAKRLANEVRCIICGKPLSDEISRRRGIGPTCRTVHRTGAFSALSVHLINASRALRQGGKHDQTQT